MQNAYNIISNWLSDNFLKLNDSKSEVILIGTPKSVSHCKILSNSISLGNSNISFSPIVKNFGVLFDENLSFLPHIKNIRKNCFITLKNLRHIRSFFNRPNFESLMHAFITSRLDYCNSLFTNISQSTINQLQSIQNYAARLILRRGLYSHITPLLFELHWLPVSDHINFKILLITYKAVHYSSLLYLAFQLKFKPNPRNLRHHDPFPEIPRSHSARMGDRTFPFVAPNI